MLGPDGTASNKAVDQVMAWLDAHGLSPREDRVARGLDAAADELHRDELLALVRIAEGREPAVEALTEEAQWEFVSAFRWNEKRGTVTGVSLVLGAGATVPLLAGYEGLLGLALPLGIGVGCGAAAYGLMTAMVARSFRSACTALYCAAWICDPEHCPSPVAEKPRVRAVEGDEQELREQARRCERRRKFWEGMRLVFWCCFALSLGAALLNDEWQWASLIVNGVMAVTSTVVVEHEWRRAGDIATAIDDLIRGLLPAGRGE